MIKVIYVKVALRLKKDVTEKQAEQIVSDLEYDFEHKLIQESEITETLEN